MTEWKLTTDELPPEGVEVVVLNGGIEQRLVLDRGLWWLPDRSMYVYYSPSLWRASTPTPTIGARAHA